MHPKVIRIKKLKPIHTLLALALALFISACLTTSTHAAGTASVEDFGAVGDGITDSTKALSDAFNSDYDTITIPEGEYYLTGTITISKGNKTIIGEKATLFADSDFVVNLEYLPQRLWTIFLYNVEGVTFQGVHFDARSNGTSDNTRFAGLVGAINASDIHFDSCSFTSDRQLTDTSVTVVDFFANWHDISITNSHISMLHYRSSGGDDGGSIFLRAYWNSNNYNAVISNNSYYKHQTDEMIWLGANEGGTTGKISNVEISGNRFYSGVNPLTNEANSFIVGTWTEDPGHVIENIDIHDNEIIAYVHMTTIMVEGVKNFDVSDNDIYANINVASQYNHGAIIGSRSSTVGGAAITTDTVRFHHNRTMTLDSEFTVRGISYGSQPIHVHDNPHITVNAPTSEYLVYNKGSFSNNNVVVNGNTSYGIIAENVSEVHNNNIYVNGKSGVFFRNYNQDLAESFNVTGNTIITKEKGATSPTQGAMLLRLQDFSMNGHTIAIRDNSFVNGAAIENDESLPAFTVPDMGSNTVTDRSTTANPQIIWQVGLENAASISATDVSFCNNTVQGFRTISRWAQPPSATVEVNLNCN